MRTIKFRAWRPNKLEMDYFDFIKTEDVAKFGEGNWFLQHLMQFTGLHDKNGKEIYEGDVVKIPYIDPMGGLHQETENGRSKVGFESGQFVIYRIEPQGLIEWCEKEKGEYVSNYGNRTIVKDKTVVEIIGNIYENPELLKL